jgi:hypothetical protein
VLRSPHEKKVDRKMNYFDPNDPAHPDSPLQTSRKGVRENARKLIEIQTRTDQNGVVHSPIAPPVEVSQGIQGLAATVSKVAGALGVNVAALLDSKTFVDRITTLAPDDAEGITGAVQSAIDANPLLVATRRGPRPFAGQGASANGSIKSPPQNAFEHIKNLLNQGGPIL